MHEHTRPDRDQFVQVNFEEIKEGMARNFAKRSRGNSKWFETGDTPFGKYHI